MVITVEMAIVVGEVEEGLQVELEFDHHWVHQTKMMEGYDCCVAGGGTEYPGVLWVTTLHQ